MNIDSLNSVCQLPAPAARTQDYVVRRPSRAMASKRSRAFTRWDALALMAAAGLLFAWVLPALAVSKPRSQVMACLNNLRLIGQAHQLWGADHDNFMPLRVSQIQGGTQSGSRVGHAWFEFAWISNELVTPKILVCPADANTSRVATEFSTRPEGGFLNASYRNNAVSYWLALDTFGIHPQGPISGDRNLSFDAVNTGCSSGVLNAAGIALRPASGRAQWTNAVHQGTGNIVLNDGSVSQTSNQEMIQILREGESTGSTHLLMPR